MARRATGYTNRGRSNVNRAANTEKTKDFRPSALQRGYPLKPAGYGISDTARVGHAAMYFQHAERFEESVESALIPRKSLGTKQNLSAFQSVEVEVVTNKQFDKTLDRVTPVGETRVTWKSDKTLLRKNNPFTMPSDIKRQSGKSKQITHDADTKFRGVRSLEDPISPASVEASDSLNFFPEDEDVKLYLHGDMLFRSVPRKE